jgi:hypothetical protein
MNLARLAPRVSAILLTATSVAVFSATAATTRGNSSEWRFNVLLDGKSIGYHRFVLSEHDGERELRSEARFNVKFLFINAYSYAHDAEERWQGECLSRLDARTNDNGNRILVFGTRNNSQFVVATKDLTAAFTSCVQSFAYWNPQILTATHLLNPQTGEYVPVRVKRIGIETVNIRGRQVPAERYRLESESPSNDRLQIDLWYSTTLNAETKQWLALESAAEGGRRLRYEMQ